MKRTVIILLGLLVLASVSSAQQSDVAPLKSTSGGSLTGLGINPASSPFSLIDLSKIRWSNSYSVAFFSGGGSSGSAGLWNTTMDYEFSSKLFLSVNLGVLHNPSALWNRDSDANATLLPGFTLDYRPSKNFMVSLSVQRGLGYYGYGYRTPYGTLLTE